MTTSLNKVVIVVGPREYGKTTIARCEVARHLREHENGLVFAHDVNVQFKDFCAVFDDIHAWKRAAAAAAAEKKQMPRAVSVAGNALDVTREVSELGKRFNKADNTRLPIFLAYDETSSMTSSGASFMGPLDTELLSQCRHWGIAPLYNVQKPQALMSGFYERATDVYILSQANAKCTAFLEENLCLAPGALDDMIHAPPFRLKVWRYKEGLVSGSIDGGTFKLVAA